jgi:hypothetical protein
MTIQGSCLCGALRYEITGPFIDMVYCHCSRCRKQQGAPFATIGAVATGDLHWIAGESEVARFTAAPGGPRHFCPHCGSPAPIAIPQLDLTFVPVGTLEGDPGMRAQSHIFAGSRASWHVITDALPQHAGYPPQYGGGAGLPDAGPVQAHAGHVAGSCLCGDVTYEFGKPVALYQCHCTRCRKARGSAHGANLFCRIEDFHWTRGEDQVVDFALPGARFYGVAFCGKCGASVPRVSVGRGIVVIPASGLDTDPGLTPAAHIFVESKAPWFDITDDLPQHAEGPPSFVPPR